MSTKAKALLTCGFAFSSGWSDVICFKRYASFAALMTGNTVKAGIAAATPANTDQDLWSDRAVNVVYYVCILIAYMLGATLFQFIKNWKPKHPGMAAAPVCFAFVAACEICNSFRPNDRWQVLLLAPTFGIQNSLTFGGAMATNTTIITGNMQKVSLALYQCLTGKMSRAKLTAAALPAAAIVSTLLAAVAGAFVLMDGAEMDAAWLFVPSGLLQVGLLVIHDVVFAKAPAKGAAVVVAPPSSADQSSKVPDPIVEAKAEQKLEEGTSPGLNTEPKLEQRVGEGQLCAI